jgi:hypothetical protein
MLLSGRLDSSKTIKQCLGIREHDQRNGLSEHAFEFMAKYVGVVKLSTKPKVSPAIYDLDTR